jgi:acyl carrier protein
MSSNGSVLATVKAIVTEISDGRPIEDDTLLIVERVIDSLTLIRLVGLIQKEFDIQVKDRDIQPENFENVQAIAAFVKSKGC